MTNRDLLVELARVRVIFQMRALAAVMGVPAMTDEDEYDDHYDDDECWNCGGEGYFYDCFEEWACIDPEGGCDLCMRRCDVCRPKTSGKQV